MPTLCDRPLFEDIFTRVKSAARRLGVDDPQMGAIGELFQCTFTRPRGDPAYKTNYLQPGALPLEWSFSELDPGALRIEFQPFDPEMSPEDRLRYATAETMRLVQSNYGEEKSTQFLETAQDSLINQHKRMDFGAFLGLVFRPNLTPKFKIYVELDPEQWSDPGHIVSSITGTVPHFRSIAISECGIAERFYYLCTEGCRLLDLEALCEDLGMPHRFPALLVVLLDLTEGDFYLPPRSVLFGIRPGWDGPELKIELVSGLAMSPDGLTERIKRLLQPNSYIPFQRWIESTFPGSSGTLPVSVVSVKISASKPALLSVYAAEPWSEP